MNYEQYRDLCRSASVSLGLENLDQLANEGFLEKDGIRVALFFDEEIVADRLFCYVDLGPIKEQVRLEVFERLLTLNLLSGTKTSGVYTIDPSSGNAIFCVHLMNPEHLGGAELAEMLSSYIKRAIELQRTLLGEMSAPSIFDVADQIFNIKLDSISSINELA